MKALTKISAILLALGLFVVAGQSVAGPVDSDNLFERIYED